MWQIHSFINILENFSFPHGDTQFKLAAFVGFHFILVKSMLTLQGRQIRLFSQLLRQLQTSGIKNGGKIPLKGLDLDNNALDFKETIDKHHKRLLQDVKEAEKEYSELYNVAQDLSRRLKESPHVPEADKVDILNLLIEKFTKYNFGVSTLALHGLSNDKSKLSSKAAAQLIEHNPGRVNSSFHMYNELKQHGNGDDSIAVAALGKLVFGDAVEIKEGLHEITIEKLIQILEVYSHIVQKDLIPNGTLIELIKACSKLEVAPVISQLNIPSEVLNEMIMKEESSSLNGLDFLYMYESSIANGVSLSGYAISKIFMPISKLLLRVPPVKESENLQKLKSNIKFNIPELGSLSDIVAELREEIQELELDDGFQMKLDLVKSAAFHSKDFAKAIYYFQHFQSKVPDGTQSQNDLKSTMSLAAVFECILKEDTKMISLAESLVPQTPLPTANNLASLVLYHGWFGDSDRAFDIYNQSLELYMEPLEGNEAQRGVLVQALAAVSLLGREVGLAQLIKQKSMENKLIDDSWEARLTNLMKDYGDIIEDTGNDEDKFRAKMKDLFLSQIISICP